MITIIAGTKRGQVLPELPSGARPVSQKVRAAIFSSLAERVVGAQVLDLYAGSGALGLEALSRGADSAVLVDQSDRALKKNASKFDRQTVTIIRQDVARFLAKEKLQYDLIFMDPPYAEIDLDLVKQATNLLQSDGVLVLSSSKRTDLEDSFGLIQTKLYGDTKISYIQKS
jgi:16S rRNA (guanine(966)-N(2))-methyltransferase RsmD